MAEEDKIQDKDLEELIEKTASKYAERMRKGEKIGITTVIEDVLSALMEKEREYYLENVEDSANGFYNRTLTMAIGKLNLKVPRVRSGSGFRPALLPEKWKRFDKNTENLLLAMLANGYSRSEIGRSLKTLNIPYPEDRLDELTSLIHDRFEVYKTSDLPNKMFAVFIDAYHAKMRDDRMKEIHIFTALGIDLEGNKTILGFWINDGSENKGTWSDIFQDLINRGLKRVVLFVTDDFPGVKEIISKLYPLSDHQLCWVHFTRNLRMHLSKAEYAEIKEDLYMAKNSRNEEEGEKHLENLCNKIKGKHKDLAKRIEDRKNNYLAFLRYPEEVRKHIYTTNAIESINAGLEYIRHELGGYFPSKNALETNYFIQIENLNDGWQRRPVPALKSNTYELRQIYTMKYELDEWEND